MNWAVISIGSNINPQENIAKAISLLSLDQTLLAKSGFVETAPVGYANQPDFINGSILIKTPLEFEHLNAYLKNVEIKLGRAKSANRFGPREIDLDIVIWNNKVVNSDFYEREFVKNSVLELLPDLEF